MIGLLVLLSIQAVGQSSKKTKQGMKASTFYGGISSSSFTFSSAIDSDLDMDLRFKTSYCLGYQFDIYSSRMTALTASIGLGNAGAVTHYYTQRVDYNLAYIHAQLGPSFLLTAGKITGIILGGGIYGGYLAVGTQEAGELYIDLKREEVFESFDVGFYARAGLRIKAHRNNAIQIQASLLQGLIDIEQDETQELFNRQLQFTVGYQIIF